MLSSSQQGIYKTLPSTRNQAHYLKPLRDGTHCFEIKQIRKGYT